MYCPERETSVVAVAKTHLPERGFSSVKPGKFYARSGGLHRLLSYFLIVLILHTPLTLTTTDLNQKKVIVSYNRKVIDFYNPSYRFL